MPLFRAAYAAAAFVLCVFAPARAASVPLTLDDAFERVVASHPDLAAFRYTRDARAAEIDAAALPPAFQIGASAENALGTGDAAGVRGVELTLSLASVIERGDKRAARIALAQGSLDALALQREARRLDLLAEVARRYLDAVAARAEALLARDDATRREDIVAAAARRVAAGGAPDTVQLGAEAAVLRARADAAQAERRYGIAIRRLAMLWDGDDTFDIASVSLDTLPPVPAFDDAVARLADTPALQRFADEARLREARLQLARSAGTPDIDWQVGVRRLQADNDWGLLGSVSIPLGSARRAAPQIRAAEAELSTLDLEREGERRGLEATLAEAWGQLDLAVAGARDIDDTLLPQLQRAAASAERAFRAGALGYLEWAQLQNDIAQARRERLALSLAAHRARIELQRLTGESFAAAGTATQDITP